MNRLNITLAALIIFLSGVIVGLKLSPLGNNALTATDYEESYTILANSKIDLQKSILNFYMNEYCENENARVVDFKYHGTMFQGVYCDKDTILLLGDGFPPLPFFILELKFEEENERQSP